MKISSVEITFFHVVIGIGLFIVYLILSVVCKQIKLRRERKTPNILPQFEKTRGLHTIRHQTHTFYCGTHQQTSSIYTQDRLKVQRTLRQLLQNPEIKVPENAVAVSIPTWCSTVGERFHQFHCHPPAPFCPCPTIIAENHYTFKMVSGRVQATYYHDRRCTCLAGICIYLRIPEEPWFFGELPEGMIMDLIGPGVKRWITPRGSRRRILVPTAPPLSPTAPPLSASESEDVDSDDVGEESDDVNSPPPEYSQVLRFPRNSRILIDELPPPNYFSLFSTKI